MINKIIRKRRLCLPSDFAMGFKERREYPHQIGVRKTFTASFRKGLMLILSLHQIGEQRLERVTKYLKVARVWIAYVDDSEVMAPVAHKDRSPPVLLLMGGGMAAGKSTVLKDILKEPFCAGADAVIIEADDRKEPDVIYRESSM
uniref:Zeta toxin domain-containing protein n=1 Tax=Brassica campestris TaxID=3711 RepID=M4E210_BRACM